MRVYSIETQLDDPDDGDWVHRPTTKDSRVWPSLARAQKAAAMMFYNNLLIWVSDWSTTEADQYLRYVVTERPNTIKPLVYQQKISAHDVEERRNEN